MKLYNLFEQVIFEEVEKNRRLISEGVSSDAIIDAIDGKYNVNILYRDFEDQPPSKRYIQVYQYGQTMADNDGIGALQIFGGSKKGNKNGFYKIFRIDRIEGWFPTKVKWVKPAFNFDSSIPPINPNGHKLFRKIYKVVSTQQETPQQTLQQEPQQTTNV
jgi:hypothetical protein